MKRKGAMTLTAVYWVFGVAAVLVVGTAAGSAVDQAGGSTTTLAQTVDPYVEWLIAALLALLWWGIRDFKKSFMAEFKDLKETVREHHTDIALLKKDSHHPFVSTPPQTPTHGLANDVKDLSESVAELHLLVAGLLQSEKQIRAVLARVSTPEQRESDAQSA